MQTLGTVLDRLKPVATTSSNSLQLNDALPSLERLKREDVPAVLTDKMLARLEAMANCPLPAPEPCPEDKLLELVILLQATLPSRNRSEIDQAVLTEAYLQALRRFPQSAIAHLQTAALERCRWFPTIAECMDILGEADTRHHLVGKREWVRSRVSREKQIRFDGMMFALQAREMEQADINALPLAVKRIAVERGYLRVVDGEFVVRHESGNRAPALLTHDAPPAPACTTCQDVGRILTLEGEEVACDCVHEMAA